MFICIYIYMYCICICIYIYIYICIVYVYMSLFICNQKCIFNGISPRQPPTSFNGCNFLQQLLCNVYKLRTAVKSLILNQMIRIIFKIWEAIPIRDIFDVDKGPFFGSWIQNFGENAIYKLLLPKRLLKF